MVKYIILILTLLLFTNCSYIIGGNCNYQNTKGTALIKSKNKHTCTAKFTPKQLNYDIEFTCKENINIGKFYPAILKKASHGSCRPYVLELIKKESS